MGLLANENNPKPVVHPAVLELIRGLRARYEETDQPENLNHMIAAVAIEAAGQVTTGEDFPKNFGDCLGPESESEPEV